MISIGSDTLATLSSLEDSVTSSYINNATVSASVLDGSTTLFTATLAYVAASNGNYRGTFTAVQTATLTPGKSYVVAFTATSSSGTLVVHSQQAADYASA